MRGATVPIPNHFSMGVKQILGAMLAVDPRQFAYPYFPACSQGFRSTDSVAEDPKIYK
jgi:hypothetical protein